MTRPVPPVVRGPRSPLAHDVLARCSSCRQCTTCDGGRREPTAYRVIQLFAAGELHPGAPRVVTKQCSACYGSGRTCVNLHPDDRSPTP